MRTPSDAPDPFVLPPKAAPAPAPQGPTKEELFSTGDWAPDGLRIEPDQKKQEGADKPQVWPCRLKPALLDMLDMLEV